MIKAIKFATIPARDPDRALDVGRYVRLLGVMELTFATLFVIPATFKLGFVLASCHFAGAIATELSHDALKVNPFIPIVLTPE